MIIKFVLGCVVYMVSMRDCKLVVKCLSEWGRRYMLMIVWVTDCFLWLLYMCIVIVCAFVICVLDGVSVCMECGISCLMYVEMPGMCVGV